MSDREIESILVTGGTGSFARAFCKHVLRRNMTNRLCVFSRGEHVQAQMRHELGNDERMRWFIGDIRDEERLARAMEGVDLVVHAAALKRIEVGRYNPDEMIKTNVNGALNVVSAVRRAHVMKAVALSTDKAYQPISPYGQTKALMEYIFLSANDTGGRGGPVFAVTRYGNVFGSAGSVLPTWLKMIAGGATELPVTDPGCTRFFMSIDEAVELVIRTAAHMTHERNIAIPALPAYRIGDLVTALGCTARVTGLPAYEKRHESMDENHRSDQARRMTVDELKDHIEAYKRDNPTL